MTRIPVTVIRPLQVEEADIDAIIGDGGQACSGEVDAVCAFPTCTCETTCDDPYASEYYDAVDSPDAPFIDPEQPVSDPDHGVWAAIDAVRDVLDAAYHVTELAGVRALRISLLPEDDGSREALLEGQLMSALVAAALTQERAEEAEDDGENAWEAGFRAGYDSRSPVPVRLDDLQYADADREPLDWGVFAEFLGLPDAIADRDLGDEDPAAREVAEAGALTRTNGILGDLDALIRYFQGQLLLPTMALGFDGTKGVFRYTGV